MDLVLPIRCFFFGGGFPLEVHPPTWGSFFFFTRSLGKCKLKCTLMGNPLFVEDLKGSFSTRKKGFLRGSMIVAGRALTKNMTTNM